MQDPGEKSLSKLITSLTTTLDPTTYVFATFRDAAEVPHMGNTQMLFRESEGWTAIIALDYAIAQNIEYLFPSKKITLNVVSSLAAVGLMAAVSSKLAGANVSCNPISGFYHDHIFVPVEHADLAVKVLDELVEDQKTG